jgi:Ca2+-binding EF-hand superfamily protein
MMTPETCALFIKGCTGEHPAITDERIVSMFKTYDTNSYGFIERQEFLNFYEISARNKGDTVRENMRRHNIRADLKKLSEVKDVENFEA